MYCNLIQCCIKQSAGLVISGLIAMFSLLHFLSTSLRLGAVQKLVDTDGSTNAMPEMLCLTEIAIPVQFIALQEQ